MGRGSRPCLTECSCAVSRHAEAGGPRCELQNQIKDSKAKVALSFQPEDGIFIKWLFGEGLFCCFPFFPGFCKPHDLGERTRVTLLYVLMHISFIHYVPIFIINNWK